MKQFFGVPNGDPSFDDLTAFLASAGDEGLTWEAKGDRQTHRWVRPEQVYVPIGMTQDRVVAFRSPQYDEDLAYHWGVHSSWSGAVAVICAAHYTVPDLLAEEILGPAVNVATGLGAGIGGRGRCHVFVRAVRLPFGGRRRVSIESRTWIEPESSLPPAAMERLVNEFRREAGEKTWISGES